MIVVRDTETLKGKRLVATIGFFDGVHLGHRFLIHELKQVAEAAGLPSAVITFPEHPPCCPACRLSAEVAQFVRREIETFWLPPGSTIVSCWTSPSNYPA